MKGARELSLPEHDAEVAAMGTAIAEAAAAICAARGWDRQAAGALALRASMELLLLDARPAAVGAFLHRQAGDLEALGPTGGRA